VCLFCLKAVGGLPAILVYKKGELIGNFVRLTDEFGVDMYPTDIESFLIEYAHLFCHHVCCCLKLYALMQSL